MMRPLGAALVLAFLAAPGCGAPPAAPAGPGPESVVALAADPLARFEAPEVDVASPGTDPSPAARPVVRAEAALYAPWHFEFKTEEACAAFKVDGTHPITRFGRFADAYVPNRRDVQLAALGAPGLIWVDQGNLMQIPPPAPPVEPAPSRATSEPIVRGGLAGLRGRGTTVVIVDSGLDFRHPDFIATDAQNLPVSRIAWFWDTTAKPGTPGGRAPVSYPNGAPVGVVWTRDDLTAELRSGARKIGPTDVNGHGTSCAGVAAGNGRAYPDRRYSGVAPEADLVAVRVGGGSGRGLENTYLLGAACSWIDGLLGSRPVVFSCSYGGQFGGRDGVHVLERQIDARFAPGVKGRTICIAAGNDGREKLHAAATLGGPAAPARIEWTVPPATRALVAVIFGASDAADLRWRSAGAALIDASKVAGSTHAITRHVQIQTAAEPGSYAIELWTASGKAVQADAYIGRLSGTGALAFSGPGADAGKQINSPGTALQAVTVGSYDFNAEVDIGGKKQFAGRKQGAQFVPLSAGLLSDYSNPGPRRTGEPKPDVTAPGQYHAAARGGDVPPGGLVESSGRYSYFNGTSASTPYVAGLVALMFQKNPSLSVAEVHELLRRHATRDKATGSTPNPFWGHGKIDFAAAKALLAAVKAP